MLSYVVRNVPGTRAAELAALRAMLATQGIAPEVVAARPGESPRATFLRALAAGDPDAPWVVHLEDDVWPAPDLGARLAAAVAGIDASPRVAALTAFTLHRGDVGSWARAAPLATLAAVAPSRFAMTQCLAVRRSVVAGLADHLPAWEAAHPEHNNAEDYMFGNYCSKAGLRIFKHVPSLVQHRDIDSLLGHPCGRRRSPSFAAAYGEIPPC